jgi:hypothetical protein
MKFGSEKNNYLILTFPCYDSNSSSLKCVHKEVMSVGILELILGIIAAFGPIPK